ncbi:MAG TPA: hypothetical protein VL485_09955 [Ktedonobacteraceae bacterium]|nr:hypothetical protein [Ktedonobacteraceae bacterium]
MAQFRADYARYPDDASFCEIVEDLQLASPQFCRCWEQQNVRGLPDGPRVIKHPALGWLEFDYVTFQMPLSPDLRVNVYSASPATASKLAKVFAFSNGEAL